MADIDKKKLLEHLKTRADRYPSLVAASVLDGLRTAIERGDFDRKEE